MRPLAAELLNDWRVGLVALPWKVGDPLALRRTGDPELIVLCVPAGRTQQRGAIPEGSVVQLMGYTGKKILRSAEEFQYVEPKAAGGMPRLKAKKPLRRRSVRR